MSEQISEIFSQIMPVVTTVLNLFMTFYMLKMLFSVFKELR